MMVLNLALKVRSWNNMIRIFKTFILFMVMFCLNLFTGIPECTRDKARADLIIFSFNRPMQLYALLESVEKYLTGIEETVIIYRAGNERFLKHMILYN